MINVGVVGAGYWGPNLIRNFYVHSETSVKAVSDLKQDRLDKVSKTYPTIHTSKDYRELVNDPAIDLIVICTPVFSHFEIARAALNAGKHVLIEKPMTSTSAEADELNDLAEQKKLKIFVDHTFLFTGAVKKIKSLLDSGEIGQLYYFDSTRVNLGLFQHDINVIWDLAPHDISIMHYLLNRYPESVCATGAAHLNAIEDVAYMTVYYPENLIAHINVNWLSPVKIRETLIAGDKKMIVWDDNQPSEKIRIYDKGVEVTESADEIYKMLIQYRTGDMHCPKLDATEGLAAEVQNIVNNFLHDEPMIANGQDGKMVVRILEAAQESLKARGREVRI